MFLAYSFTRKQENEVFYHRLSAHMLVSGLFIGLIIETDFGTALTWRPSSSPCSS
jgi:cell division protein FtsW (lipid II flippase)